jgi:hypothetical protein
MPKNDSLLSTHFQLASSEQTEEAVTLFKKNLKSGLRRVSKAKFDLTQSNGQRLKALRQNFRNKKNQL